MAPWMTAGDPAGFPVIVHHGTPGPRALDPAVGAQAAALGLLLVMVPRPGYPGQDRRPGRTVADGARTVQEAAARFGWTRVGCLGYSGGGPHALAAAALLPGLVAGTAVLASPSPTAESGAGPSRSEIEARAAAWAGSTEAPFLEGLDPVLTDADRRAVAGPFGAFLAQGMIGGAPGSVDGWLDDEASALAPWGFSLESIRSPVLLIHGDGDLIVPASHSQTLAAQISGAERRLTAGDGHFSAWVNGAGPALAWIANASRR